METLLSLSNDLAAAVERAARAVVAVHARPRLASTGVHWRPGVVVTADHTVRSDDDLRVTRPDGRAVPATLAGRDPATDLAVLRVADLAGPPAERGDPARLRVGHVVLAVGHGPRASWGVVSTVGEAWRTWRGGEIDRLIRPDLTLYPGFSGGPLVDARGDLVGIVPSGLARQLELAVPASTVERVVEAILATGRVARGYLGVGLQPVTLPETLRRAAPAAGEGGLVVVNVEPDGPAARAGILLGDVLVALDGRPVEDTDAVQAVVVGRPVGSAVTAALIRAGAPVQLSVATGERPVRSR
jgi:S1-C subfamily serine protease